MQLEDWVFLCHLKDIKIAWINPWMGEKCIKSNSWNEVDCEAAIKEVQKGKLIRQATKDHYMDDGT